MTAEDAWERLQPYLAWNPQPVDQALLARAREVERRHRLSWWDSMVVGAARSSGDLAQWTDAGPLWITHRSVSWNDLVESPHLFEHDGLWYLFFTTNSGQPLSFATGPNPLGPVPSWTYQGRLATMLGINTLWTFLITIASILIGQTVFRRLEGRFAQDL